MGDEEYDILHEEFAVYPGKIKFDITLTNRRIRVAQTAQGSNSKNEEVIMLDDVTGWEMHFCLVLAYLTFCHLQ